MKCHPLALPLLALLVDSAAAQPLPIDLLDAKLRSHIQRIDEALHGVLGIAAIDLTSGRAFLYHSETVFPTASTIKVPILIEIFRLARAGEVNLSSSVTLQPSESVGGSGLLKDQLKNGPVTLTVEDLIAKMIIDSDNTATNRIIAMTTMDRVNKLIQELGARQTRLRRIMMDTAAATKGNENVTTPLEIARIMEGIHKARVADPEDCKAMLAIMKRVPGAIRTAIPASIEVASKTGTLPGVFAETAIVFLESRPFVLSVYSTFLTDGENPIPEIATLFYNHFDRIGKSNAYGNRVR